MNQPRITAQDVHQRVNWPSVLRSLGVGEEFLLNRHGPCPACGGTDRYRFDNRRGRGDYYCGKCGAGSGFDLLMKVHGWDFREAFQAVLETAGLADRPVSPRVLAPAARVDPAIAKPSARVRDLARTACRVEMCPDAVEYLEHRRLWPLPDGCTLKAHPAAEYWQERAVVGRYPAILGEVRDVKGELVTMHVTYLEDGRKLQAHSPARKVLGKRTGRLGCAIRLLPPADGVVGVAEGIETALAAHKLHGIPAWSCLDAGTLAKFEPPEGVSKVVVFADRDDAGLEAAELLMDRLAGSVTVGLRAPREPAGDWADGLTLAHRHDTC